ncbi:MAG: hypothetical protein WA962_10510 [Ornithinimicrobium sp.]
MTTKGAHRLTQDEARRIAVQAALLADDRPADLMDAARRLTMLPLRGDRLVGKVDVTADHERGELLVDAVQDDQVTPARSTTGKGC